MLLWQIKLYSSNIQFPQVELGGHDLFARLLIQANDDRDRECAIKALDVHTCTATAKVSLISSIRHSTGFLFIRSLIRRLPKVLQPCVHPLFMVGWVWTSPEPKVTSHIQDQSSHGQVQWFLIPQMGTHMCNHTKQARWNLIKLKWVQMCLNHILGHPSYFSKLTT